MRDRAGDVIREIDVRGDRHRLRVREQGQAAAVGAGVAALQRSGAAKLERDRAGAVAVHLVDDRVADALVRVDIRAGVAAVQRGALVRRRARAVDAAIAVVVGAVAELDAVRT